MNRGEIWAVGGIGRGRLYIIVSATEFNLLPAAWPVGVLLEDEVVASAAPLPRLVVPLGEHDPMSGYALVYKPQSLNPKNLAAAGRVVDRPVSETTMARIVAALYDLIS